ncbi:4F2 cell-surface antigen heavy chain isoform X1 [Takifugu rubripes]|uniref:Si:dkey-202g17.3 n=1 Tax=Takifugu rubripes TaxID=31033 RepID=H2TYD5_TAKRU|nr:4F2 cell-surface antigen heavy chain-like isoform X1 [Takifugu rubripes]XP_029699733.1 4F2 cell-surface antigen heavy chain-like isoform X1 [Takifugu rubripes]|eukprot:XP_011606694.1 PREDICTED: 4F2 cell-surface antigen heavy chain-like [Takifugu rubripes]
MPLNAGDGGYGAAPGARLVAGEESESAPLLVARDPYQWKPLTSEELEVAAGGPGWKKMRCYLIAVFWFVWLAMLVGSVTVVVMTPRPVVTSLTWWQKSLFYQVQPSRFMVKDADESSGFRALCEQLADFKALSAGALILQGVFGDALSPFRPTPTDKFRASVAQIQHLLTDSNKLGLKVVLDICDVNVTGDADEPYNRSTSHALQFWLEQGVAGFAICDTDAAYSEETLLEWRSLLKKFSDEEERILVVRQTGRIRSPINATLVDVVMRSILPSSPQHLSASDVRDAIETHLQTREEDIWIGWTAGRKVPQELEKLLLVLMMTLPGSPAVQYNGDIDQTQSIDISSSSHGMNETGSPPVKARRSSLALLTSLSNSRSREEALLFGSFFSLPFSSLSNSSFNSSSSPPPPILAFLRSWSCVQFAVLLNVGPELRAVDPAWASSLPDTGMFVASTEMDRLGSTTLNELHLRPYEAVIIKLLETRS